METKDELSLTMRINLSRHFSHASWAVIDAAAAEVGDWDSGFRSCSTFILDSFPLCREGDRLPLSNWGDRRGDVQADENDRIEDDDDA